MAPRGSLVVDPDYRSLAYLIPGRGITPRMLPMVKRLSAVGDTAMRPAKGAQVRDIANGDVRVRVYRPSTGSEPAALLWIHGGGLIFGTLGQDDPRCSGLALALGITVVSAEYRTAPEHRFPRPLDDCAAAWDWLLGHADELGVDPARVVLGGASAGGGLAAALAQRLHDEGGRQPAGVLLVYPMLDDRTAADESLDDLRHPVWTNVSNRTGWTAYLGQPPASPTVPRYAVPARRDDLSGLPPTWIGVGTADLFADECHEYARRLRDAGVSVDVVTVPGAPHGFDARTAPRATQSFVAAELAWLERRLALPSSAGARALEGLAGPDRIDEAPIRLEASVEIAAPPSEVWPFIADHPGWTDWFAGLSRVVVTGRGHGTGGRRRVVAGPARFDEVFTVWEPERQLAYAVTDTSLPGLEWMAESVTLEPAGSGTRLVFRQGIAARQGFGRLWSLLGRQLSAGLESSLRHLKQLAEEAS